MRLKFTLLTMLLVLLGWHAIAQVTSSSMTGFVKDETNKGLPGATIRAVHQPSGTIYGAATQNDGGFNINNMRVGGPYKVEISYIGYETRTYDNIYLTLGEPYQLNAQITQGGKQLKEVSVVAGRNPILNNQRTGASTNISTAQLNTLPTVSRSLSDFTRLSPQSGPSFSSNLNNGSTFGGRDGRYNNVQVNGANLNNGFGLSTSLMPGGSAQPISLDAIEEVQIGIAPYDVRQSGFTGANINAVTRSGTNEFHGSAYMYWRNQNFNGMHAGKDVDLPAQAATTNNIYGARLGGPIIKNKLFFFVNGEYEKYVYPGVTWVASRPGLTGPNVSRTPADSLEAVANYVKNTFGYDPGGYENYGNTFTNKNTKVLARLDWNISQKHKFYISYSQLNATEDQLINATSAAGPRISNNRIGSNSLGFQNSNYSFEHLVRSVTGEFTSNFSNRLSNQLIGTYSNIRDQRKTPGSQFPFVDIALSKTNTNDNYISLGTELFSYQNDLKNTNFSVIDNITYNAGAHTITGGVSYEYISFGNSFLPYGTSYYRYASVSDFINDRAPVVFGYSYPYDGATTYVNVKYGQGSIYLQDKYNVTKRLALTAGLRLEMPFYTYKLPGNQYIDTLNIPDKNGNLTHYDVSKWPKQKPVFSPRIAFNWDAFGNRSLQLRGGTGIFAGRVPFVWFTNQPGNSGTLTNQVQITDAATLAQIHFNPDPNVIVSALSSKFPQQGGSSVPGQIAVTSPDLKMPQLWRTNIGADFKLPFGGLIGTAEAIFSKDIVNVYQRNANLPAAQATLANGADNRPYWTNNRVYSNISGIYVLENTNKGESFSFTVGLARPARKGFYGSLYYTITYAEDISSNPGSQPNSAWNGLPSTTSPNTIVLSTSQYLTPHRLVGNISYRFEYARHFGTTVSLYYEGASLGRFSYLYNTDINKDGTNADLIYIPNDAAELKWADIKDSKGNIIFTQQQQIDAFNNYIDQDKYLRDHKGGYAERYGAKYPFYSRFDFKLLQDIFTNLGKDHRYSLQFSLDMLNVGNFINPNWGVQKRLNVGSGNNSTILNVATAGTSTTAPVYQMPTVKDNAGNTVLPTSTFVNNVSTLSTWGMQLGLRFTF